MSAVDLSQLCPGDELHWVGGLRNPNRRLVKGDLTRALEAYRRDWQVPDGPDRITVHVSNAFLEKEAEGIPFRAGSAVSWGIYMRYPGKAVTASDAGKVAAANPIAPLDVPAEPPLSTRLPIVAGAGESVKTSQRVSKIRASQHTGRGRPHLTVPRQLSLADQKGLSLRKRGVLLGVSAATVLRRDREKVS